MGPHTARIVAGIPAYNEAGAIGDVVARTLPHVDLVLVVDDGSRDATATRARSAGARVLSHDRNRGYGAALGTIFSAASHLGCEHLVIIDGDGQHDPADIPALLDTQQQTGAEIVIGSRYVDGRPESIPAYRRFGLAVVNRLTNLGLRIRGTPLSIADTQSGFRAYDRRAITSLARDREVGTGMDASLGILFHAASAEFSVAEVPTAVTYDVAQPNSQNPVLHGLGLVYRISLETAGIDHERVRAVSAGGLVLVVAAGIALGVAVSATFLIAVVAIAGLAMATIVFTST